MLCAQCNQTIPDKVDFCAYCGVEVRRAQALQPLRFPQSESAADRAGLVGCCSRHWDYARDKLYDGTVERWLRSEVSALFDPALADQVRAIVQQQKQQDVGLDQFLRALEPTFPLPRLEIRPAQLDAGAVPWQQRRELPFEIYNVGSGCFSGQVNSNAAWLNVQLATLICVAGRKVAITVSVDTRNLQPGQTHQAQVEVQGNSSRAEQMRVTVMVPAPQLEIDPPRLNLGNAYQGEQLAASLTVRNRGGSTLEARVQCADAWLTVQPTNLRVEPGRGAEVRLTAETGQLHAGTNSTDVQVTARAGAWQAQVAVPTRASLPWFKTLWHRWRSTLNWAAGGVVTILTLLFIGEVSGLFAFLRMLQPNVILFLPVIGAWLGALVRSFGPTTRMVVGMVTGVFTWENWPPLLRWLSVPLGLLLGLVAVISAGVAATFMLYIAFIVTFIVVMFGYVVSPFYIAFKEGRLRYPTAGALLGIGIFLLSFRRELISALILATLIGMISGLILAKTREKPVR